MNWKDLHFLIPFLFQLIEIFENNITTSNSFILLYQDCDDLINSIWWSQMPITDFAFPMMDLQMAGNRMLSG